MPQALCWGAHDGPRLRQVTSGFCLEDKALLASRAPFCHLWRLPTSKRKGQVCKAAAVSALPYGKNPEMMSCGIKMSLPWALQWRVTPLL